MASRVIRCAPNHRTYDEPAAKKMRHYFGGLASVARGDLDRWAGIFVIQQSFGKLAPDGRHSLENSRCLGCADGRKSKCNTAATRSRTPRPTTPTNRRFTSTATETCHSPRT